MAADQSARQPLPAATLLFDPELHAAPAVRIRRTRGPYMDKITTMTHLPHPDTAVWRRLKNVPRVIPDLSHTGLMSEMSAPTPAFMRPDGRMTSDLRNTIKERVRALPDIKPNRDMAARDKKRIQQASLGQLYSEENYTNYTHRADDDDDEQTLEESVFEPSVEPGKRTKKPYSTASLATLMLEAEYG
ncbi:hypothetical protein SO694_00060038 [Aureococcus anophagefferens]|uniref:Uncharacterized protein n=1 Tax=Aureococcus anophagefferens TaxID=44056 RepID=A0ABR1FR02_AURAN|nr:hypothetical protein JL720_15129 [Aureococcus anophagefferens]